MEDLRIGNTIPHHATAAKTVEVVEAIVVDTEERLENDGGGNIGNKIAKDNSGGDDHGVAVESFSDDSGGSEAAVCSQRKRGGTMKQSVGIQQQFREREMTSKYSITPPKRGRGRPRGSDKWRNLAPSLGGITEETAGTNFAPHIIAIEQGENIVQRIRSFSQMTPDSICIISAFGTISIAEIFMPCSHGGILRYEGEFTIVYLNGSHTYTGGIRSPKKCHLSVQLANSEGQVFGGAIAGSLIAAGPTQVIIATFSQNMRRKRKSGIEASKSHPLAAPITDPPVFD